MSDVKIKISADATAARKALEELGKSLEGLESNIDKKVASTDKFADALKRAGHYAAAAFTINAFAGLAKDILDAGLAAEKLQMQLKFITGSSLGAATELHFLREQANKLGLDFAQAATGYAKFAAAAKGTSLEGESAREVFLAISKASTVLGMSGEETAGALNAVQQMISKGTVSAEELRGQLGERLPGAFQISSRAMGMTTKELGNLLETGDLATTTFLPRFAEELNKTMGDAPDSAAGSAIANINRLKNDWSAMLEALANSGAMTALSETARLLGMITNALSGSKPGQITDLYNQIDRMQASSEPAEFKAKQILAMRREINRLQDEIKAEQAKIKEPEKVDKTPDILEAQRLKTLGKKALDYTEGEAAREKYLEQFRDDNQKLAVALKKYRELVAKSGQPEDPKEVAAITEKFNKTAIAQAYESGKARIDSAFKGEQDALKESIDAASDLHKLGILDDRRLIDVKATLALKQVEIERNKQNALIGLAEQYKDKKSDVVKAQEELSRLQQMPARIATGADRETAIVNQKQVADFNEEPKQWREAWNKEFEQWINDWDKSYDEAIKSAKELEKALGNPMKDFAESLKATFGMAGQGFATMIDQVAKLQDAEDNASEQRKEIAKNSLVDSDKADKLEAKLSSKMERDRVGAYATMAGAAKGFFNENSKGYQALEAAEKAFRVVELGLAFEAAMKRIALNNAVAASTLGIGAGVIAVGLLSGAFGGKDTAINWKEERQKTQGTGTAFGDLEAKTQSLTDAINELKEVGTLTMKYSSQMAGSLRNIEAGLKGVANIVIRGGGIQGGNAFGVNETSSRNALFSTNANTTQLNSLLNGSLATAGLSQLTPLVDRVLSSTITQAINPLTLGLTNAIGKALGGKSKTEIIDSGIQIATQTIGNLITGGDVSQFATVRTTSKKNALASTKTRDTELTKAISDDVANQFGLVFQDLQKSLTNAALALDKPVEDVAKNIESFKLNIGKISLRGLSGEKIQEELNAVFSKAFDQVATAVLPSLQGFTQVGEGYYDTVLRVASGFEQAGNFAESLGLSLIGLGDIADKQGDVATELLRDSIIKAEIGITGLSTIIDNFTGGASDLKDLYSDLIGIRITLQDLGLSTANVGIDLIKGAGGLDNLQNALKSFNDNFLSDADKLDIQLSSLENSFAKIGIATPKTNEEFKKLVEGIDGTTESGAEFLGKVLALSDSFAKVSQATDSYTKLQIDAANAIKDAFKDAFSSIQTLKDQIRQDVAGIKGVSSLRNFAQIGSDIGAINPSLPSNAGVVNAQAALTAKATTRTLADTAKQGSQSELFGASGAFDTAKSAAETSAIHFVNALSYVSEAEYQLSQDIIEYGNDINDTASIITSYQSNLTAVAGDLAKATLDYASKESALATAKAELTAKTGALTTAIADESDAKTNLANAQGEFTKALNTFATDSKIGVSRLTKLREETLAYYNAQKALADGMMNSAKNLRATVSSVTLTGSQLSPEAKLKGLQGEFAAVYADTLVSSGDTLAKNGDKLNALINPLLEAAKDYYASSSGYFDIQNSVLAQAQTVAGKLETLAPADYETLAISTLGEIDSTLTTLNENALKADGLIVSAIDLSRVQTVGELNKIYQQLGGTPTIDGSHATGLASVPFDGYTATLHKGEAIIDAGAISAMRKYGITPATQQSSNNDATLVELKEQNRHLQALVKQQGNGMQAMVNQLAAVQQELASMRKKQAREVAA